MKITNKFIYFLGTAMFLSLLSCDLDEDLQEDLDLSQALEITEVDALIQGTYNAMHSPFIDQSRWWAASQHTTDETIGPTRAGDWDDNGVWRVLHDHTWNADHAFLGDTFNELLQVVFSATNVLSFQPTAAQAAEARFLRAFAVFAVADGWGQVPVREPGENLLLPPQVLTGVEAVDFVISETEAIMNDLPDGPVTAANKDAARVLLMKAYLNKGAFTSRSSPTFEGSDLAQVIALADQIAANGYEVADNFYDNFAPSNGTISTENIFTYENIPGRSRGTGNNVRSRWFCTLHYNNNPSGWNGFATIADFYDKFDDADVRKSADYDGVTDRSGLKVGFLEGQQFDENGTALTDRPGNPLIFTKDIKLIETESNFEVTGVRVIKYPPDYDNGDNVDNDLVFYRYSDVLLMKAEAILRSGGSTAEALALVNQIRQKRGVADLATIDLDGILDERGFELYWEGHRRQDLIRFGKYLDAYTQKPVSGTERLFFPIPSTALAVNPNLSQNPNY